jgi:hypothetical protein
MEESVVEMTTAAAEKRRARQMPWVRALRMRRSSSWGVGAHEAPPGALVEVMCSSRVSGLASGLAAGYRKGMRSGQVLRLGVVVIVAWMAVACGGCSSFNKQWEQASGQSPTKESVTGTWEGTWTSNSGHGSGRLRCILTQEGEGSYLANFESTYWGVFRFGYTAKLAGQPLDGRITLAGEEDLGWLRGGKYRYAGYVTPEKFECSYAAKYDNGTFVMTRPGK